MAEDEEKKGLTDEEFEAAVEEGRQEAAKEEAFRAAAEAGNELDDKSFRIEATEYANSFLRRLNRDMRFRYPNWHKSMGVNVVSFALLMLMYYDGHDADVIATKFNQVIQKWPWRLERSEPDSEELREIAKQYVRSVQGAPGSEP
jgi:hypothetical protein